MCDTMIANGLATRHGKAIFAKNSDRHPNESQHLVNIPAKQYAKGDRLQCTYIEIPQVRQTYATLLSQPFWMWGAEMGINEHGLVIGNEAVFTKTPAKKAPALLGMDLLRLGLERAKTPQEAIDVITKLLEEFGQGGNCHAQRKAYYQNSYIIANHREAWVLETVDREWAARQIDEAHNISNCLSIQTDWDRSSDNIARDTFDYRQKHANFIYDTLGKGVVRQATISQFLKEEIGDLTAKDFMQMLRHHRSGELPHGFGEVDICMHAGFGFIREDQTTASMVAVLDEKSTTVFATGTSAPCTGIFKPLWIDTPLDGGQIVHTPIFDENSLFWSHEPLHRTVLENYSERLAAYANERDALEREFVEGALSIAYEPVNVRAEFSAQCFRRAAIAERDWLGRVEKISRRNAHWLDRRAWQKYNRDAKMPE